ncbi:MAG: SDR family oxidoreductase [Lachnospiraceae bacterium]|nr:SDR family oxidoreductase [Lachnospiraceae bacterium]MBQ7782232.1 SDR family oxidoreductase [Lachnospiraceae bacterium]
MENKVYLVLGASSDVGVAFIKGLEEKLKKAGEQATVIAHYASSAVGLEALREEVQALQLVVLGADFGKSEEIDSFVEKVKAECDCPDYIVHLPASKFEYNRIKQFDWQQVLRELEIQVHSLGEIAKAFMPKMAKRKSGKVAVMLTAYTIGMPPKFMSQYVIAKYALLGLMKSMAIEYADKGINVNGISPNMMETKFLEKVDEKIVGMTRENSTMKRNVNLSEVVQGILFLLSEGSDYMNGVNLNMTGGDR